MSVTQEHGSFEAYISDFVAGYIDAAFWSTSDEDDALEYDYDESDLAPEARVKIVQDCLDFITANWDDLSALEPGQAGHDFLLTRDGRGAGFGDRGLDEVGERLTQAAKVYGDSGFYVGNDGQIYVS